MNTHIVRQKNFSYDITSIDMLILEKTRNWMGPLNDKNELEVDEKKTKTEKFENFWKLYGIIKITSIRSRLTALGNCVRSILDNKLMRPVSVLRLHKEKRKKAKTANSKRNWARKVSSEELLIKWKVQ